MEALMNKQRFKDRFEIGFMQGRLSPKPSQQIQAFPKDSWREEFFHAQKIGFDCIELIYDTLYLEANPLDSDSGRRELVQISKESGVRIGSICADYFMTKLLPGHQEIAIELLGISQEVDCSLLEFPFVDSSSLKKQNPVEIETAILMLSGEAEKLGMQLGLETDLPPVEFRELLKKFPSNVGANLDLGNSAALGYDALAECRAFGDRVVNVHIKDRLLGGTTVPLLTGQTDFKRAFEGLSLAHYQGDFILQTAPDPDYLGAAAKYRSLVKDWSKDLWI
jgi:L-ribulose-5-phosphate 3-epimerase